MPPVKGDDNGVGYGVAGNSTNHEGVRGVSIEGTGVTGISDNTGISDRTRVWVWV
jgi:hypothetical protein